MNDLPTIEQELTRKALVQVERLFGDYKCKRISRRELELCLDSVWNVCSGLTQESFHEVITAASMELRQLPQDGAEFTFFMGKDRIMFAQWKPGNERVVVRVIPTSMRPGKAVIFDRAQEERPTIEAHKALAAITNKALLSGMKILEDECG